MNLLKSLDIAHPIGSRFLFVFVSIFFRARQILAQLTNSTLILLEATDSFTHESLKREPLSTKTSFVFLRAFKYLFTLLS